MPENKTQSIKPQIISFSGFDKVQSAIAEVTRRMNEATSKWDPKKLESLTKLVEKLFEEYPNEFITMRRGKKQNELTFAPGSNIELLVRVLKCEVELPSRWDDETEEAS